MDIQKIVALGLVMVIFLLSFFKIRETDKMLSWYVILCGIMTMVCIESI